MQHYFFFPIAECPTGQVEDTTLAICAIPAGMFTGTCTGLDGDIPSPLTVTTLFFTPSTATCDIQIVGDDVVAIGNAETCIGLVTFCVDGKHLLKLFFILPLYFTLYLCSWCSTVYTIKGEGERRNNLLLWSMWSAVFHSFMYAHTRIVLCQGDFARLSVRTRVRALTPLVVLNMFPVDKLIHTYTAGNVS